MLAFRGYTSGAARTYMTSISETKTVQMRYSNISAVLLHPHIRCRFAAKLLVNCPGMLLFSKLIWHRTSKNELPGGDVLLCHLNKDTNVEGTLCPGGRRKNRAIFISSQTEMMSDYISD
jgi:hypothetical protein